MTIHAGQNSRFRAIKRLAFVGLAAAGALGLSACRDKGSDSATSPGTATTAAAEGALPVMYPAPDFELTDQNGETFSSEQLEGHVWVADFIFTRCPGPCPIMTQNLKKIHDEFDDAEDLRFVSITVDPEHDTPEVFRKYARKFGIDSDRWFFLTGERQRIVDLSVEGFKLAASAGEAADDPSHPIIHSQRFVLVDGEGNVRGYYNGMVTEGLGELRRDLRRLLGE